MSPITSMTAIGISVGLLAAWLLVRVLASYRREMQVLFVGLQAKADFQDTQALESVLAKVRDLFKSH